MPEITQNVPGVGPVETGILATETPGTTLAAAPSTEEPKGLDKFAFLLDNGKDDKSKPTESPEEATPFDPVTLLGDEEAVNALLSKVDFSNSISPETQAKLQANDPSAIMDLVQDVSKASYLQALQHGMSLMSRHVDDRFKQQAGVVTTKINSSIKDADLASQMPELNNPIVKLGVDAFQTKLRGQNPSISNEDVVSQTREYLKELNSQINPVQETPEEKQAKAQETDWLEGLPGFS